MVGYLPLKLCIHNIAFDVDSIQSSGKFGEGTGPIFADFVNCTGSEPRLWSRYYGSGCHHFNHYYGCSHNDDVGVQCKPGMYMLYYCRQITLFCFCHLHVAHCLDGQLNLFQLGFYSNVLYGHIKICSNQRWESLSYQEWTSLNAYVACTELGFSGKCSL